MENNITRIEAYYQALTFKRMWLRFRGLINQYGQKAYRMAKMYFDLFKRSCQLAGI